MGSLSQSDPPERDVLTSPDRRRGALGDPNRSSQGIARTSTTEEQTYMNEKERTQEEREARLELVRARRAEIEEHFRRLGIPYKDTTLEHEGEVVIRFRPGISNREGAI